MSTPSKRYLESLKHLVLRELKNEPVKVFLFGSRARGSSYPGSDVDIAVWPVGRLDPLKLVLLREKVEESSIPYKVDLVNLQETSADFKDQVVRDGILWKDYN